MKTLCTLIVVMAICAGDRAFSLPQRPILVVLNAVDARANTAGNYEITLASGQTIIVRLEDYNATATSKLVGSPETSAAAAASPGQPAASPPSTPRSSPPSPTPTARCRDGSVSYSKSRSGICSGHGVAQWF